MPTHDARGRCRVHCGCRLCSTAGVCRSREFWQEAVGMSRLTGHQDAQGRESEESPKTAPGNNGTGRHDAGRNPCTTASAAPLSTSPAASGWRRSTRRRSTPSVGRSPRMGARRGAPLPRGPTPPPRGMRHPAEPAPGRAARRRHWPRCRHYWPARRRHRACESRTHKPLVRPWPARFVPAPGHLSSSLSQNASGSR